MYPQDNSVPAEPVVDDGGGELMARPAVLKFFGGDRPLNAATLYRGIKEGRFPPPIKIGPKTSRWLRSECEAKLREIIADRRA